MIKKTLFDKVQSILNRPQIPHQQRHFIAFRGMMFCKECGCMITGEIKRKPSGKSYIYYHCSHSKYFSGKRKSKCATGYYSEEQIINLYADKVIRPLSFPKEILSYCKDYLSSKGKIDEEFQQKHVLKLKRKLIGLRRYQELAYEDKLNGTISENDWIKKNNKWKNLEVDYQSEIDSIESGDDTKTEKISAAFELSQQLYPQYFTMNLEQKAKMSQLVSSNSYLDHVSLYPVWRKPFDIFAKGLDRHNYRE